MKRLYPRCIDDKFFLSQLLECFLNTLQHTPFDVQLRALAYDSGIPECILLRLQNLHHNPVDAPNIQAEDFHIVFSNLMFRFPTIRLWMQHDGNLFIEM